jgi:hypothetical protein
VLTYLLMASARQKNVKDSGGYVISAMGGIRPQFTWKE